MVDQLNLLYVDPFLKLAQYYHRRKDSDTADRWREKALILARRADDKESIKKIEASRKD
jgi:hypothetical protein